MPDSHNRKGLSRRATIASLTATPLLGPRLTGREDESVIACENWLNLHAKHERLARRWQRLETRLAREHNYLDLTDEEQLALPQARGLHDINERLDALHEEQEALLKLLPELAATSVLGLSGKLAVAAIEVCPEENKEAHRLIASILRDYRALHGG